MARGDMGFNSINVDLGTEILNRTKFEGVSITLDFTSVSTEDAETGEKMVKAGTPIKTDGTVAGTTPWAGAVGLLLDDVYASRPQGTVLKRAYVNTGRAQTASGLTYDAALVATLVNAGCNIIFEDPAVTGTIPGAASE